MGKSKNTLWVGLLNALFISRVIPANPIQVSCGDCRLIRSCSSGICARYNGGGLNNVEQCLSIKTCPNDYPFFYFVETCFKDSGSSACQHNCCAKLSSASSAPKTCTDHFPSPDKFCQLETAQIIGENTSSNGGAIAGAVVGTLVGIFALMLLTCCIYHECYVKKKRVEEGENEQPKKILQQKKAVQKTDQKYQTDGTDTKRSQQTQFAQTMESNNQHKKKGEIKTKKSRAQILEVYGKPRSKSEAAFEAAQDNMA